MALYESIFSRLFQAINRSILTADETRQIASYFELSLPSRYLFCRVYLRRDTWLRYSQLAYEDVENVESCCRELVNAGFFDDQSDLTNDLEGLLNLLQLKEIRQLASVFNIPMKSATTKNRLICALVDLSRSQKTLFGQNISSLITVRAKKIIGTLVRVRTTIRILLRCVYVSLFLPRTFNEISFTSEILTAIGRRNYPQYKIEDDFSVFPDRSSLDLYIDAISKEHEIESFIEKKDFNSAYNCYKIALTQWQSQIESFEIENDYQHLIRYHPGYILTRTLGKCDIILTRLELFDELLNLINLLLSQPYFCYHKRADWWKRLLIVADRRILKGDESKTSVLVDMCHQALGDPFIDGRGHYIVKKLSKISKNKTACEIREAGVDIPRVIMYCSKAESRRYRKSTWIINDDADSPISVEEMALHFYGLKNWKGIKVEGGIFSTIFALLFWDVLFADMTRSFFTPFQNQPLDLNTEFFYERRKTMIDLRLSQIIVPSWALEQIRMVYNLEYESKTICVGLTWDLQLTDIEEIVLVIYIRLLYDLNRQCLGSRLAAIMDLYAQDYRKHRSGVPDLTLWNSDERKIKLVEVKGPGDSLMDNQVMWLQKLLKLGIDAEVCIIKDSEIEL